MIMDAVAASADASWIIAGDIAGIVTEMTGEPKGTAAQLKAKYGSRFRSFWRLPAYGPSDLTHCNMNSSTRFG